MHEMPAGAQLIRILEWEQVWMLQKKKEEEGDKNPDDLSKADLQNRWKQILGALIFFWCKMVHLSVKQRKSLFLRIFYLLIKKESVHFASSPS